jgi:Fe2+ or Zn2+ uptake regulation protein
MGGKIGVMEKLSTEDALASLTRLQRIVLAAIDSSYEDFMAIKQILKVVDKKLTERTIRRALAKLCEMGLVERIGKQRKGRGYASLFRMMDG